MTPDEQLSEIRARASAIFAEQRRVLRDELLPELEKARIQLLSFGQLSREQR